MATNPAADPTAFEGYYYGLPGCPKLLARSNPQPWMAPSFEVTANSSPRTKTVFVVTHHSLREKLDAGLRDTILGILATMNPRKWISVDYLRIGYEKGVAQNNPVVTLITVDKDEVPLAEAQRVVDAIAEECKKVDLPDVEVEVMEGQRSTSASADQEYDDMAFDNPSANQPILDPTLYPLIGSSIAISRKEKVLTGRGTLGGYVLVDGVIMGLTNHQVAFGDSRLEAFPTAGEEISRASYHFMQPAEGDLEERKDDHEIRLQTLKDFQAAKNSTAYNSEMSSISTSLAKLELWTLEKCVLGTVWRSSGIRAREGIENRRFRLDWALIWLDNPERFSEPDGFVNEIPDYASYYRTKKQRYFPTAMKAAGVDKKMVQMPNYLKRHLTLEETLYKQDTTEEEDKKFVVWKFGRSTHFTFGILSTIHSNYLSTSGIVTDELAIVPHDSMVAEYGFSGKGDSGSLVWDSDGYVSGLLWGGPVNSVATYITPMEYVLEDIRQVCGAKDVKLVIRKEDETNVEFGPPERQPRALQDWRVMFERGY